MFEASHDFYSVALGKTAHVTLLLPQAHDDPYLSLSPEKKYPVVTLLHGAQSDPNVFLTHTHIKEYAQKTGFAIVLAPGGDSYYADMASGEKYFTFHTQELPQYLRSVPSAPLSFAREDQFIAGYSMGGRGALLFALSFPERYAAAASLSGSVDTDKLIAKAHLNGEEDFLRRLTAVFGDLDRVHGGKYDVYALLARAAKEKFLLPALYLTCGEQDRRYRDQHLPLIDHLHQLGIPVTHDSAPGGHDFAFWDQALFRTFDFFKHIHTQLKG